MKLEEKEITNALLTVFSNPDIDNLFDTARINAFLMDLIPQYPKERKLIISAMNLGIAAKLKKRLNSDKDEYTLCLNRCVRQLTETCFITDEAAQFAVSVISESLCGSVGSGASDMVNAAQPNRRELIKGATDKLGAELTKLLTNYETIGYKAFAANPDLIELEIPPDIHSIKSKAFLKCFNLKRIVLHDKIDGLGDELFSGCNALSDIEIPGNPIYSVCDGMLVNCRDGALMRAANTVNDICVIPEQVVSINAGSFERSGVKEIVLSPETAFISSKAFVGCEKLQKFQISRSSLSCSDVKKHFTVPDGILYNGDMTVLIRFPSGCEGTNYIVEGSMIHIADSAFSDAVNLESITFTGNLRTIGRKAFERCVKISSLLLPNGIVSIEERAFQYCIGLKNVMLPQSIETIGDFAFCGCASIETVSFPGYVKRIGHAAFMNCSQLYSVIIQENVDFIGDKAFDGCSEKLKLLIRSNEYAENYCDAHNINWENV